MPKNWIDVISAGPGSEALLTGEARAALTAAETVYCAQRTAPLVEAAKRRSLTPLEDALAEIESRLRAGQRTAVLVSGDAGLYSLLGLLRRKFGAQCLRVIPGVSSLQAFCAQMRLPWQEARMLSVHGRDCAPEALCHYARTNAAVLLLLDARHDPHWLRRTLDAGGLEALSLTVGENLSCPDERVAPYEAGRAYGPLSVALIENPAPEKGLPPIGLADDQFVRGKTPMTKREIRIQVLAALRLPPDAVVWDIGAGTGSITVECARQCPMGQVYAIERDAAALELIAQNVRKFHLQNVTVIAGSAPEALGDLPAPTHVFVGGTGGETEAVLARIPAGVRLCATAVTMETAALLTARLSFCSDFSAAQIAVSRLERVGGYQMLRAQNPVFVFSAVTGDKP